MLLKLIPNMACFKILNETKQMKACSNDVHFGFKFKNIRTFEALTRESRNNSANFEHMAGISKERVVHLLNDVM